MSKRHSYFLISDIHGMYDHLIRLLKQWDKDKETLVVMGDLMDRGPDSKKVLLHLYQLSKQYDVRLTKGNHDEMFLSFLSEPHIWKDMYYGSGGRDTMASFYGSDADRKTPEYLAARLKSDYPNSLKWLETAPPYIEDKQGDWTNVFVHAGVDLTLPDWKDSSPDTFSWIRRDFVFTPNKHPNTRFFFGHTPTTYLHPESKEGVFETKDNKVGIDGGACFGGKLIGMKVKGSEYTPVYI